MIMVDNMGPIARMKARKAAEAENKQPVVHGKDLQLEKDPDDELPVTEEDWWDRLWQRGGLEQNLVKEISPQRFFGEEKKRLIRY